MDFSYANETVCWVHVGDSAAQTQLKCARMPGLKGFVDEHTINISLSLHRESPAFHLEDGVGWGDGQDGALDGSTPELEGRGRGLGIVMPSWGGDRALPGSTLSSISGLSLWTDPVFWAS